MALILTAVIVHFIALISPGPDFILVSRNALASRRADLMTTVGIVAGMGVHVAYSLLGIGFVIAQSIVLYNTMKYAGAAYLLYIGWKCLRSKAADAAELRAAPRVVRDVEAMRMGFLCNILNPKATLFFLALFTQMIDPQTPLGLQLVACGLMMMDTALWFGSVTLAISAGPVRRGYERIRHGLERVMGVVLIALGLRVALSRN